MNSTPILIGLFAIFYGLLLKMNARKISEKSHKFDSFLFGFKYSPDSVDKGEWLGKTASYFAVLYGLFLIVFHITKG